MKLTAKVDGMHCASCAAGIETFLKSQEGVVSADVDYEGQEVTIEYNEDADLEQIWGRIDQMGFEVKT